MLPDVVEKCNKSTKIDNTLRPPKRMFFFCNPSLNVSVKYSQNDFATDDIANDRFVQRSYMIIVLVTPL